MLTSKAFVHSIGVVSRGVDGAVTGFSVTLQATEAGGFLPENHSFAFTASDVTGLDVGGEVEIEIREVAAAPAAD